MRTIHVNLGPRSYDIALTTADLAGFGPFARRVCAKAKSAFVVSDTNVEPHANRVAELMRQAGLKPVWKRKFVHTTDSKHGLPVAANILARQFNPSAPNKAYVSDITYVRTGAGWL